MSTSGELIHGDDYAFAWRAIEPRPERPRALVVLLHGADGDEHQWAEAGAALPSGTLVALPRGPRSISGGRTGWYRVGLSDDGLQVVQAEADDACARLVDFVDRLQSRFDVPAECTWLAGFSQGGSLAASAALMAPDRVAGFAMLAGHLLDDDAVPFDARRRASPMHALLVHGRDDDTVPLDQAREACERLAWLGISTELRTHDGGHCFTEDMGDDLVEWLATRIDSAKVDARPRAVRGMRGVRSYSARNA